MARRKRKERKIDHSITQSAAVELPALQETAWRAVGSAVRGVSHERLGLPCQDAQAFRARPDGTLLIALADGAGSARYSDQGARLAVDEALRSLDGALQDGLPADREGWEMLLREAFSASRLAVLRLAEDSGMDQSATLDLDSDEERAETGDEEPGTLARQYASTLTCVVATPGQVAVGQIGDGAVVALAEDEQMFAITRLQRGEYANETHFITQEDALDQLVFDLVEQPVKGLAVMSDGLIRLALKMPAQEPHAPFFQPLFRFAGTIKEGDDTVRQLSGFLNSERVNARTDDDKSLVLAVRLAAQEPSTPTPAPESGEQVPAVQSATGDQDSLDREGK